MELGEAKWERKCLYQLFACAVAWGWGGVVYSRYTPIDASTHLFRLEIDGYNLGR